jgi:hypothetical protein
LPVPRAAGGAEGPEAAGGWGDDKAAPLDEDADEDADEDGEPGDADPGTPARTDDAEDAAPVPAPGCPAAVLPYATADT